MTTKTTVWHVRVPEYVDAALDELVAHLAETRTDLALTAGGRLNRAQVLRLAIAEGLRQLAEQAAANAKNKGVA